MNTHKYYFLLVTMLFSIFTTTKMVAQDICPNREVFSFQVCDNTDAPAYNFYLDFLNLEDRRFKLKFGEFIEREDGTATLSGDLINVVDDELVFYLSISFSGRTNQPQNSTLPDCLNNVDDSQFYYYTSFEGDLLGNAKLAGTLARITSAGNKLQVGNGANWMDKELSFGAATNIMVLITSNPANYPNLDNIRRGQRPILCNLGLRLTDCNAPCTDADGDGICDEEDCHPNNASLPGEPNTPCDDGDDSTINDVVQADLCTCQGVEKGEITFDCNDDITATAEFRTDGVTVNYDAPTAISTCALEGLTVTLTEGLPSGSTFPIGTSTVTYVATDECDNEEACTFTITVEQAADPCAEENAPLVTIEKNDPDCAGDNGTIIFSLANRPDQSPIEFSLDGGQSYPLAITDNSQTAQFDGLIAGEYAIYVRWGNEECLTDLGIVTLTENSATPGSTCDDGDATTINDVILEDGCACAGEVEANNPVVGNQLAENQLFGYPCGIDNRAIETYIIGVKNQNSPCFDIPNPENVAKVTVELWVAGRESLQTVTFTTEGGTSGNRSATTPRIVVEQASGSGEVEYLFRETFDGNYGKVCTEYRNG